MAGKTTAVHVTHETVNKVGGIGAVLHGFFPCQTYLDKVERSILVGPLFTTEGPISGRLGENSELLYSSIDGFVNTGYAPAFHKIEHHYGAGIIYGTRTFVDEETGVKSSPEVVLVEVRHMERELVAQNKTAVLFVLSTEVAQRRSQDIYSMEAAYKWPVAHCEGQVGSEIEELIRIDRKLRDYIEASQSEKVAMQICSRLPKNEAELESIIETGYDLAKNMSWDVVVRNYLLPILEASPQPAGILQPNLYTF